jgi:hypothetical protein
MGAYPVSALMIRQYVPLKRRQHSAVHTVEEPKAGSPLTNRSVIPRDAAKWSALLLRIPRHMGLNLDKEIGYT